MKVTLSTLPDTRREDGGVRIEPEEGNPDVDIEVIESAILTNIGLYPAASPGAGSVADVEAADRRRRMQDSSTVVIYAALVDLQRRLTGKTIGEADSSVTEDQVDDLLAEASAEVDQELEREGWHTLPLDLSTTAAAPARAIYCELCTVELAAERLQRLVHGRTNTAEDESAASVERDRLLLRLQLPLPGLPRREPLDDMAHLYDLTDSAPDGVVAEVNRRLRAYRTDRPRVLASTAMEATGTAAMLRPYLRHTPGAV